MSKNKDDNDAATISDGNASDTWWKYSNLCPWFWLNIRFYMS